MDKNRLWVIGAVLAIGAIVVLGWLLGISPKLTEVRANQAERDATVAQNAAHEAQIVTLKNQFDDIDALKDDLAEIRLAVPAAAEAPALVAELNSIAGSSQVVISGLTQNDAQAFDPALLAVVPATAAPEAGTPAPPSASPSKGNDLGAVPAPAVDPRLTATNFIAIPISITVDGPYDRVLDFVSGVQHGDRLVMVTAVSTTIPTAEGSVTGTITALVYVLLDPSAMAAAPK